MKTGMYISRESLLSTQHYYCSDMQNVDKKQISRRDTEVGLESFRDVVVITNTEANA